MTSTSLPSRVVVASLLFGLLGFACGDSGHPLGQANGGKGGGAAGATGTGGGGGAGGTGQGGGSAGATGLGGHAGAVGTGGGPATGGAGGGGGQGTGGGPTGGAGGAAGRGGSGGTSAGGSGGQGGQGTGGAGGAGGAQACSSAPLVACPANEVCDEDTPNRCGAGYEPGHCIVLPQSCPTTGSPVCACNATTYANDCQRQMARVQLDHTGACAGAGGADGGSGGCGNTNCTSGQICVHPVCLNCGPSPPQPAPFCAEVPAGCAGTPSCTCLPSTVCEQNGQSGGACLSIDSSGVQCG